MHTIVPRNLATGEAGERLPRPAWAGVAAIAALGAVALLLSTGRYGYFGDELYFRAAGDRLSVSYADQGPALPLLAHLMDLIAPGSVFMLRLPAVLLTVAAVVMAALIAREFGGGRGAQLLTAGAYAASPFLLGQGVQLATNTVDTALWTAITWVVVRWVRTRADRWLLVAGVLTALDFQVKWLIPFFWIALGLSVLVFGPRELLRRPLLWLGAAVVVISAVPSLLWQAGHGWPQLKMGAVVAAEQAQAFGRLTFIPLLVVLAGLLGAVLLVYGLWRLMRSAELRPYRFLAPTMLLLTLAFLVQNGRPYYVAGMLAVLMAAGAVELTRRDLRSWVRWLVLPLALVSAATAVYGLPWRAPEDIPVIDNAMDSALDLSTYGKLGWPELAARTADAYRSLPPEVAARTVLLTNSYWQASALDQLGTGLPPVYSTSRGFWFFGAPPDSVRTVLYLSTDQPSGFASVRKLATVNATPGMPGETRGTSIWLCEQPAVAWSVLWPRRNELG